MANMEEAQQKALLPYEILHGLNNQEAHVQKVLQQQDSNHLLASILKPEVEPLRIPLIQAEAGSTRKKSVRKKAEKNAFIKFVKKIVYFKPKTFWGTQILIPLLSVLVTLFVSSIIKNPKREEVRPHKPRIVHQQAKTNKTDSIQVTQDQIVWSLNTFGQLYRPTDTNRINDLLFQDHTIICPVCNQEIQIISPTFYLTTTKSLQGSNLFSRLSDKATEVVRE